MAWKRATSGLVVLSPVFFWAVLSSNLDAHACFFNQLDRAILAAHVLEVLGVALCRLPGPIHLRAFRDSFACIRDAACHGARAMAAQGWSGRHNGEGIRSMEGVSEGGCRKPKPQSPYPKGPLVRAPVHQARPTGGTSPPPIQARASPV